MLWWIFFAEKAFWSAAGSRRFKMERSDLCVRVCVGCVCWVCVGWWVLRTLLKRCRVALPSFGPPHSISPFCRAGMVETLASKFSDSLRVPPLSLALRVVPSLGGLRIKPQAEYNIKT